MNGRFSSQNAHTRCPFVYSQRWACGAVKYPHRSVTEVGSGTVLRVSMLMVSVVGIFGVGFLRRDVGAFGVFVSMRYISISIRS